MASENALVLRGLSIRLLKKYFEKMNAVALSPLHFAGEGWSARLQSQTVTVLKSEMEEITVEFEGNAEAVRVAIAELRKKTLRGGG